MHTALWRVVRADGSTTGYTNKADAQQAVKDTIGSAVVEQYNQFTGQWDEWETQ